MTFNELITLAEDDLFKKRVKALAYRKAVEIKLNSQASANQKATADRILSDDLNIGRVSLAVVTRDSIRGLPTSADVTDLILMQTVIDVIPAFVK